MASCGGRKGEGLKGGVGGYEQRVRGVRQGEGLVGVRLHCLEQGTPVTLPQAGPAQLTVADQHYTATHQCTYHRLDQHS